LLVSCLALLFLAGCWDRWEIEERGFIMGVGLDLAKERPEAEPVYAITLQKVLPGQAGFGARGQGGGGQGEPVYNITTLNPSIFAGIREVATRVYRQPFMDKLLIIVVGEDLARRDLQKPLDFFLRNPRLRWNVRLFVTSGEAREIIAINQIQEPITSIYLSRLAENDHHITHFPPRSNLGDADPALKTGKSFVLARIEGSEKEAKLAGAGVFKRSRLVGWLDEFETSGLRFLTGEVRGGAVAVTLRQEGHIFRIAGVRVNCWPRVVNGELRFAINVWLEGDLAEDQSRQRAMEIGYLQEIEERVAAKVKTWMEAALVKLQREYRADVVGFGRQVEKRYPDWWQEVKDEWEEELFPHVPVDINVQAFIRRSGK